MINIGSLARIDHLALIAASILRINSSRAVIKHQMPVPTLLPEHFTAHLGWAGAGTREGEPSAPEDANRQSGNPSASSLILVGKSPASKGISLHEKQSLFYHCF